MPSYQTFSTQPANASENNFHNRTYSRSGLCTVDTAFGETATAFMVTVTGSVIVEGVDGVNNFFPVVTAGTIYPFKFRRTISAATIQGNARVTSATGIYWLGGAS